MQLAEDGVFCVWFRIFSFVRHVQELELRSFVAEYEEVGNRREQLDGARVDRREEVVLGCVNVDPGVLCAFCSSERADVGVEGRGVDGELCQSELVDEREEIGT